MTCWRRWNPTASRAKSCAWRITTSNPASAATKVRGTNGRISAKAHPRGRHLHPRDADLAGPALQHRQAGAGAVGRLSRRDRRCQADAGRGKGSGRSGGRQRRRGASLPRRQLPGTQRRWLHNPGEWWGLLGRRGHEVGELCRPEKGAEGGQRYAGNAGFEHNASCSHP